MRLDRVIAVRNSKMVYRDGDRCIKVFHKAYAKAEVLREALNHAVVEETGLPVPKLLEVTVIEGKWAIAMEYFRGKTLKQHAETKENKHKEIEKLVAVQREIQEKNPAGLTDMRVQMAERIERSGLDSKTQGKLLQKMAMMPVRKCLCHGELDLSNIIISDFDDVCILDWSHAAAGDPSADAAKTYLMFILGDDNASAEYYLGVFCRESGISPEEIKAWMPIIAAAELYHANEKTRGILRETAKQVN